jgi:uncharacterized membrane protein
MVSWTTANGENGKGMVNLYNRIQGRSLERLAAMGDGISAVGMTLLELDLHIPTAAQVHGEGELLAALCAMVRSEWPMP